VRTILIVGIGAGDPDQLTVEAARAIGTANVFFIVDKGAQKRDLAALRDLILRRHAAADHRVVEIADPPRQRDADDYVEAVEDWRRRRADLFGGAIRDELAEGERGAFLVWGDPAIYDSTLAIVTEILAGGLVDFDYTVVPGVSSITTLAARHRIALNRVGGPILVTTGRRLAEGFPDGVDDVVVMLDAHCTFTQLVGEALEIFWGAYLGTADEILIAGPLSEVATRIVEERERARNRKGWIMDTYLLRRREPPTSASH
jgi:precorrin-6A synthase